MRLPRFAPLLQLFFGDTELDGILHGINVNNVSILHKGDRSADLGLGRDVTDAEPVRPVGVCAVSGKKTAASVSLEFTSRVQKGVKESQNNEGRRESTSARIPGDVDQDYSQSREIRP